MRNFQSWRNNTYIWSEKKCLHLMSTLVPSMLRTKNSKKDNRKMSSIGYSTSFGLSGANSSLQLLLSAKNSRTKSESVPYPKNHSLIDKEKTKDSNRFLAVPKGLMYQIKDLGPVYMGTDPKGSVPKV